MAGSTAFLNTLLKKLADPSVPHKTRLMLAHALRDAGGVYRSNFEQSATRPWQSQSEADPKNSSYLTRIAELAASTSDADLTVALVGAFESDALWGQNGRDVQIQMDLDDAAVTLRHLYQSPVAPGAVRYAIEKAMDAIGDDKFSRLASKCGPLLTLAEPLDSAQYALPASPSVFIRYDFRWRKPTMDCSGLKAFLVLRSVGSGKETILPSQMIAGDHPNFGAAGGGGDVEALPANFIPGRYQVFYRFRLGTKVFSEGDGFETLLPQPVTPRTAAPFVPTLSPRPSIVPRLVMIIPGIIGAFVMMLILRQVFRAFRQQARLRRGLCSNCGYDLRASAELCSECGTPKGRSAGIMLLKRQLARIGCVAMAVVCVASAVFWARSYFATDCFTRSAGESGAAIYTSRGSLVLELPADDISPGWNYEHARAAAYPRTAAEAGASRVGWRMLGIEFSPDADLTVIPLWLPLVAGMLSVIILCRKLRKDFGRVEFDHPAGPSRH